MTGVSGSLIKFSKGKQHRMGALPEVGFSTMIFLVRLLGVIVATLVLIWTIHYRGGLSLASDNKDLIFNVGLFCSIFLILASAYFAF